MGPEWGNSPFCDSVILTEKSVFMGTLLQDVCYGLRTLRRNSVFTAVGLLTIAIGIGANAAVFSVVNGVLLKPLPFAAPEELVAFGGVDRTETVSPPKLSSMCYPDFFDFRERCLLAGINVPIIAGIMPITSFSGFKRMADLAAGSRFPAKLLRALQRCEKDPEGVKRVGVHYALEQCHDLLDNRVAGIHFYTLNRSDATRVIFDSLGIPQRRDVQAPIA